MPTFAPSTFSLPRSLVFAIALVALSACSTRTPSPVEDRTAVPRKPGAQPPAIVATPGAAPVAKPATEPDWRPRTYTVKRGDTLQGIALEYGLDYRDLAAWNGLENANLIRVGQVLRLSSDATQVAADSPVGVVTTPLRPPGVSSPGDAKPEPPRATARDGSTKTQPKALKEPYSEAAMREIARASASPEPVVVARAEPSTRSSAPLVPGPVASDAPAPSVSKAAPSPPPATVAGDDDGLDWTWPAKGKVIAGFSDGATLKGIDIGGSAGQPVLASAAGRVVYAGSGLRGYGKLVIIKHNDTYLSAYAHNREIAVKEGQSVTRGQKIAEMGNTDTDQVKLHFEIRRLGKPMDPLKYLPAT